MNKTTLIIKREYLSRVMKKSFLLVTLLTPLGIGLIMFIAGYLGAKGAQSEKKIIVKDDSGIIVVDSLNSKQYVYSLTPKPINEIKKSYIEDGYDILLHVPAYKDSTAKTHQLNYYSKEKLSFSQIDNLEKDVEKVFKQYKLDHSSIDKKILDRLNIDIKMENALLSEKDSDVKGDKSSKLSSAIATGMSYGMGFLMYMVIFIFGSMVMRSVMEEKINRIIEVMISSVRPFQLMLGKIIGVGLVGLTQLFVWIVLTMIIGFVLNIVFGSSASDAVVNSTSNQAIKTLADQDPNMWSNLMKEITSFNWFIILPVFIIFFFGGYFIYSSMFAAVGSAVGEDMGESQQLMMPLTIPVILALVMVPAVFNDPDGPIAIFGSMFPLFSPILMPARLPFDPPIWQIGLSILFLIGGVVFFTWIAARIYRVGILMYGKKVTFKELAKWVMYKD